MSRQAFAPLVVLSLLLQVTLAAQGNLCVASPIATTQSANGGNSGMAGMRMPASSDPKSDSGNHSSAPAPCQPMASCASVITSSAAVAPSETVRSPRIAALVALEPDSRSTRPELPPPRV